MNPVLFRRRGACALAILSLVLAAGCASRKTAHTDEPAAHETEAAAVAAVPARPMAIIEGKFAEAPDIAMGDPGTVARIIDEGKNRNQVMNHLTFLSTEIGSRLTGSTAAEHANNWAKEKFESWGLANAHLWQWGEIPVRFDRGPCTGKVFIVRTREPRDGESGPVTEYQSPRDMEFTTTAWGPGTSGPVRGAVVRMPTTEEEFAAVADKLPGAWVLIKSTPPGGRRGVGGFAGGARARAAMFADFRQKWAGKAPAQPAEEPVPDDGVSGKWDGWATGGPIPGDGMAFTLDVRLGKDNTVTGSYERAGRGATPIKDGTYNPDTHELKFVSESRGGASTFTITVEDGKLAGSIAFTSSTAKMTAERPTAPKGPSLEERVLKAGPAGFIAASNDDRVRTSSIANWNQLDYDNLPQDVEVQIRQSDYDYMNSRLADGVPIAVEFNLDHRFTKGPIPVYNTIAEIPGSQWPEQVVIVSAHVDSWNGPGSQGTTDNGTGTCVTLEAARILMAAGAKPKRTIRFILWTGEEQGLLGSRAYVQHIKDELPNISAVLVDDGGTNYEGGLKGLDSMIPMLAAATAPITAAFPEMPVNIQKIDRLAMSAGGGSSDHASFVSAGVPGFFWDEVGRADYGYGWHTQHDKINLAIPEYLVQSSTCAAVTAYNLACADELLPREPLNAPEAKPDQASAAPAGAVGSAAPR